MKQNGANMEFAEERFRDLMQAYDRYIEQCKFIRMEEVYAYVANAPAPRFYVSDVRATNVITDMMQGGRKHAGMRPLKKEMFNEIYRRVSRLKEQHPAWTIKQLCEKVIDQPAPKFYITPGSVKIIVCKGRKRWIKEKSKKLRFFWQQQ